MAKIRVLLAGESWVSNSTHFKGWDFFSSTIYETGIEFLKKSLEGTPVDFNHLPNHLAPQEFPSTLEELNQYQVIFLSDIGANTLLLPPEVWLHGNSVPNRLALLKEWVLGGGGLAMCGGYYSYAGIYGGAKYYRTAVEEVLPVNIYTFDDRVEKPEGAQPEVVDASHPIVEGITSPWPKLLGLNELILKPDAHLIARAGEYPLLAVRLVGKGRTLTWASDIGPHWCPMPFIQWGGYTRLWLQAIEWLAGKR
jgi:uncharacterized membrane protein